MLFDEVFKNCTDKKYNFITLLLSLLLRNLKMKKKDLWFSELIHYFLNDYLDIHIELALIWRIFDEFDSYNKIKWFPCNWQALNDGSYLKEFFIIFFWNSSNTFCVNINIMLFQHILSDNWPWVFNDHKVEMIFHFNFLSSRMRASYLGMKLRAKRADDFSS